jgi:hypothetical protein
LLEIVELEVIGFDVIEWACPQKAVTVIGVIAQITVVKKQAQQF